MLFFYQFSEFPIFAGGKIHMAAKSRMTRREILTGAAGAAAAASLSSIAGCFPNVGGTWPDASVVSTCGCNPPDGGASVAEEQSSGQKTGASTVVTIQRDDSIDPSGKSLAQPQLDAVQSMVDAVLSTLAGGAVNPWSVLLPNTSLCTRIGLKVNCLSGYFPTSPAVVRAIIKSLLAHTEVCPGSIIVWDRRLDELQTAGMYTDEHLQGAQLLGTITTTKDWHGPKYSTEYFGTFEGSTPRLSRILTEMTDVTINCPVLKHHTQSGVTAAMKNIYGMIDTPGNFHNYPEKGVSLSRALPAIYNIPQIRNSIKLTIVDALQAVVLGDTDKPVERFPGRIFASTDPVALDRYALDLINQMRVNPPHNQKPSAPIAGDIVAWLDNAYQLGIGTKDYKLVTLAADGTPAMDGGADIDAGAVNVADPTG
jgi:uncharacterized protein (DUF362 family)